MFDEGFGLQFSPDDKTLLHESKVSIGGYLRAEFSTGRLIPSDSGAIKDFSFQNIKSAIWLSNAKVLFKYQYTLVPPLLAVLDLRTGVVETLKDSMTYFNTPSPDRTKLAFATANGAYSRVWINYIATKKTVPINTQLPGAVVPASALRVIR